MVDFHRMWVSLVAIMVVVGLGGSALATDFVASGDSRAAQWREDIWHLAQTLPTVHVNPFFARGEEEFRSGLAAVGEQAETMSDIEIYVALARQIAKLGDSHTSLGPKLNLRTVPVQFMEFADGVYPVVWSDEYPEMKNARLIGIGDVSVSEIYETLGSLIPYDNRAQLAQVVPSLLNNYDILVATGLVAEGHPVPYLLETEGGSRVVVPLDLAEVAVERITFHRAFDPQTAAIPLYMSRPDWFWQQYLAQEQVLYIAYNVCWDKESERQFDPQSARLPHLPDFPAFTAEVFDQLAALPVKAIIIDLRLNGGGNSALGTRFIERLAEDAKVKDEGVRVYGIIGRNTFSSAIINALDLKRILTSPLYGEATAGKPNHYGEVRSFELPHSQWTVSYSTKYFQFVAEESDSLYPDVAVAPTFADFASGRDPVLERLLDDLRE